MKLAINQAYFFPYIGYFQLINSVDKFIVYENVSFRKRSWITRNRILMKGSGEPFYIHISVKNQSSFKTIKETNIGFSELNEWKRKFLKLIKMNYAKANHFDSTFAFLETIIQESNTCNIHQLNSFYIKAICQYLNIKTIISSNNEQYLELEETLNLDYDNNQTIITDLDKKTQRILSICIAEKANQYINLPGAGKLGLYKKSIFEKHGIKLSFIHPTLEQYNQFRHRFVPHLSIIDVLMHNGIGQTKNSIEKYKTL